ncbi:TonB-dependent receptor plug domain-containing protein [Portibacter marinus]|uniref:TonB-dependent receptor plug domain-containing protein n=1 Tax=Portibacter marinus TaxID=2898660 RepID=UPI001F3ECE39|nr:TonB-dependent receptor [Portibacter marinus]
MRGLHFRSTYLKLLSLLFLLLGTYHSQCQKTITITDQQDEPLIGVEIYNDQFTFAKVSDLNGQVEVSETFENEWLNLKYLGFKNERINLKTIDLQDITIKLEPTNEILEEVILVGRSDIRSRDFLQKIDAVRSEDIAVTNPQTSVDALARNADVYVQKSQMGGGSPVIRGFEANKVLLVVDGVRLNNAIYRNGHLQNAITIDNSMLEQMEVIYGPSSLMYGSDALGGVIHFRTKDPVLNLDENRKARVFGNYFARYGSANQEKTVHGDINIGFKKWASLTSVSYSDFDDLRMGSRRTKAYPEYGKRFEFQIPATSEGSIFLPAEDRVESNPNPNIQVATGYSQFDFLQKFRFQINDRMNITANIQSSTSSDIPRYDQLIVKDGENFRFAEWYYGPQDRSLYSLKYKWTESKPWMDEFLVIASRQNIEESRIQRGFGFTFREVGVETVGVSALTIDAKKDIFSRRKHTIYYGADFQYNTVQSEAWEENIIGDVRNDKALTRYPSAGSTMNIGGIYAQYINESPDSNFVFHGGLRFSSYATSVKYLESDPIQWPSFFYDGVNAINSSVSWSAGINWQPTPEWTLRLLSSTAFRAPNVDDIGKLRINNDNVVVPNTSLDAEQSWNGEVNINRSFGRGSQLSITSFYTRLTDVIIRQNFMLPDGSTTFISNGLTYNVEANVNAEEAEIYGLSVNFKYSILNSLLLSSSLNFIKGSVLGDEQQPLSHLPPLYGRTQLEYNLDQWNFTLLSQYNGRKPLEEFGGSVDNPEYATPEGALGWTIVNAYADYKWRNYTFQLGVENIFDKHYRPFASGVSGPGLNVIAAIRGSF